MGRFEFTGHLGSSQRIDAPSLPALLRSLAAFAKVADELDRPIVQPLRQSCALTRTRICTIKMVRPRLVISYSPGPDGDERRRIEVRNFSGQKQSTHCFALRSTEFKKSQNKHDSEPGLNVLAIYGLMLA